MPAAIGEHALLADGRTAALVDATGEVAWLCWPRIDSAPCLLSLLDERRGGTFSLRPTDPEARVIGRAYVSGSLILRTVWASGGSEVVVEEALAWTGPPRLIRTASCERGSVELVAHFAPAFDAGRSPAGLELRGGLVVATSAGMALAVSANAPWVPAAVREARCAARVAPGEPMVLALSAPESASMSAPLESLEATRSAWMSLSAAAGTRLSPLAERTLGEDLAGRLLTISTCVLIGLRQRGGGIVAAPTTSLPQWPGSSRTWDYRYSWLRDSSLAATAMARMGLRQEAGELGAFIGDVAGARGPRALVTVDGAAPPSETVASHLDGHGGARPVRFGNAAAGQPQLDVCGEVIELASVLAGLEALPESLRHAVPILADWTVANWQKPDHGIWEIRGEPRRYTHSRLLAWFGLREATALAGRGQVRGDRAAWGGCAQRVATAILGTTAAGGALQLHDGGGGADAALALAPLLGFLPPGDPRIKATLAGIVARLSSGGMINRYEGRPDGLDDPCGPFLFPTFWTAMALHACGDDGTHLFAGAAAARGSTGLFGEVADPSDGSPLGNYPQVQSHATFILAATVPPGPH